jgi:hypothetical protein
MKRKAISKEEWLAEGTPEPRPEQILLTNHTNRQWFLITEEEKEEIAKES